MAAFRIGQRVRIVSATPPEGNKYIGMQGVIVGPYWGGRDWVVEFGRFMHQPTNLPPSQGCFFTHDLAPLTDPKADQFIENIKRLKPYEDYDAYRPARKVTA